MLFLLWMCQQSQTQMSLQFGQILGLSHPSSTSITCGLLSAASVSMPQIHTLLKRSRPNLTYAVMSVEDFQMGVEVVRLYHHSWRDRSVDKQGVWAITTAVKLGIDQVTDIVRAHRRDFGNS